MAEAPDVARTGIASDETTVSWPMRQIRNPRHAVHPVPCGDRLIQPFPSHVARIGSALATMTDMSKTSFPLLIAMTFVLTWGCGSSGEGDLATGAEVTIEMPDGSLVTGRVAQPAVDGASVAAVEPVAERVVRREPAAVAPPPALPQVVPSQPVRREPVRREPVRTESQYVEVTVPAGTTLSLMLDSMLASDVSKVEDPVWARLDRSVMVDGLRAIPQGSMAYGTVTTVNASGKVRARARLAFRFDQLDIDGDRYEIRSDTVSYTADSTRTKDAKKIGIGAGAGALIGGLLGGKKGAGTGAAIGGGAGTAMVLTTAGEEVRLRPGTSVEVTLAHALVLLIPQRL